MIWADADLINARNRCPQVASRASDSLPPPTDKRTSSFHTDCQTVKWLTTFGNESNLSGENVFNPLFAAFDPDTFFSALFLLFSAFFSPFFVQNAKQNSRCVEFFWIWKQKKISNFEVFSQKKIFALIKNFV